MNETFISEFTVKVLKKLKFAFRLSIKVVTKSFETFYKVDFVLNKN